MSTTIAAAPVLRPTNVMLSIEDLENEIADSESMYNQVTIKLMIDSNL
jgi:hypothetical protein